MFKKYFSIFLWLGVLLTATLPAQQGQTPQPIQRREQTTKKSSDIEEVTLDNRKAKNVTPREKTDFILQESRPSLLLQALAISMMALMPFIIMLLTPYLKFVVVLSLLRTALGVQNSPPNMIINGVALLMSLFIMYPTAGKMYDAALPVIEKNQVPESFLSEKTPEYVLEVADAMQGPVKDFLQKNSSVRHQRLFYRMIYKGVPQQFREGLSPTNFVVLVPSYIVGQLKEAFEIGVLIYIPFFVIDLVVSNILLAMGMMMLSPVTISMPLKLFLLVMLDGWTILIEGLVETFR